MTLLRAQDLTISIGKQHICENVNFEFKAGEMWGLIGVNGSGKTTLLHTLAKLRASQAGVIYLDGVDINQLSHKDFAKKLAILLQVDEKPFPVTVLQSVLVGRHPHLASWSFENHQDYEIANAALATMQLSDFENRNIQSLSGGEYRRLALATLLTQQASIYLLDEPTNHLDLNYQIKVLKHFSYLAKEKACTVIMALHDINLASRFCDNIIVLLDNVDVRVGKTKSILTQDLLQTMYQHDVTCMATEFGNYWILN